MRGVEDFDLLLPVRSDIHLDVQVAFRNGDSRRAVTVDAHGPQMNQVHVQPRFDDGAEHVVRARHVVLHGVPLLFGRFHGIGRGALFGEVHDGARPLLFDQVKQSLEIGRDIDGMEVDPSPGHPFPGGDTLVSGADRRQRFAPQFFVDPPPGEIVDDTDLVARSGQAQRRRPAAKPIPAQDHNVVRHQDAPLLSGYAQAQVLKVPLKCRRHNAESGFRWA